MDPPRIRELQLDSLNVRVEAQALMPAALTPQLSMAKDLAKDLATAPQSSPAKDSRPAPRHDDAVSRVGIPKPAGQVTRIKRGGYTLISALGWDNDQYKRVQLLVHSLAEDHLDTARSYAKQDSEKLEHVCKLACKEQQFLKNYQDAWPVHDFLRTFLQKSQKRTNKGR
ncbi:hypothetical protein AURDEDRAFT_176742 [Auricularia subglabra TFB-10046 SS5]|uniref:Uncharacterized protein n=1 Tax=Auricularia subglabra (strain TFB-10046 / SS5) TaxID=717982 RepID=J0LCG8_AURST|nr:hypothetical protein AURDEDRAFT_176742 [Auricularia subglabra TFB-10046 SS5]